MDGQNFNNGVQNVTSNNGGSETNALAIVSLVLGIISIIAGCCGWLGIVFGIIGIVCAVFANKQSQTGLAKGGLICSIIGIVLGVIMTIIGVLGIAAGLV